MTDMRSIYFKGLVRIPETDYTMKLSINESADQIVEDTVNGGTAIIVLEIIMDNPS